MANTGSLRAVSIGSFLVAFPLCLAHGILSHNPIPAVGLAPLAFSSALSVLLIVRRRQHQRQHQLQHECQIVDAEAAVEDQLAPEQEWIEPAAAAAGLSEWPFLVFLADTIHAAALMTVLVFTWLNTDGLGDAALSMLAAYATMPILLSFFVHLYLASSALYAGLAVHGLVQYVAWQAVPPECPNCNYRLRPDSAPPIPWFQSLPNLRERQWTMPTLPSMPAMPSMPSLPPMPRLLSMPRLPSMPSMPAMKAPEWKTPAWLQGHRASYASLFHRIDDAEVVEEPYTDDPEQGGPSSLIQPEPTEVVKKNSKSGKSASLTSDDEAASLDA